MNTISPAQPYWFISSWVAVISAMNIRSQEPMSVVSRQSTRFRRMESRAESIEAALKWIKDICTVPEVGQIYDAKVVSIVDFGAFLEFLPGKEGLMHISEYDWKRTDTLEGLIEEGDIIKVKIIAVDEKNGKLKLSRKALLPKPEGYTEDKPARGPRREGGSGPRREGGDRGGSHREGGERRRSGGERRR